MTDLEARLQRALAADDPPARDPLFRVEVMMRRERTAFRRRLATAGSIALVAAILTPLMLRAIGEFFGAGDLRLPAIAIGAAVLTAVFAAPYVGTPSLVRALSARLSGAFAGR